MRKLMMRKLLIAACLALTASPLTAATARMIAPWPVPIDPPVCPDPPSGYTYRWIPPVYRTESVPVFVNERVETKCERVWIEPAYDVREVVRYERGRRLCTRERVCVRPGHWETVERPVVVDVEQCGHALVHGAAGGTWMTEKNKPSCRMALAKFS